LLATLHLLKIAERDAELFGGRLLRPSGLSAELLDLSANVLQGFAETSATQI
jgi:hypothetical protein